MICLPSFVKILLNPVVDPPFLQTICAIIVKVLLPSNTNSKNPEYLDLGKEVFSLIDAITYSLPEEYQSQLSRIIRFLFHLALHTRRMAVIPQTADVLTTMLSKDQPPSFIENSSRTLSYLSTRVLSRGTPSPLYAHTFAGAGIFRSLLSFPEDTLESGRNIVKLPQVDRMCALLIDSSRTSVAVRPNIFFYLSIVIFALQGHSIRASVLTTLISLVLAHEDTLLILSESPFFIPSLVKLLADLSTALWEEDPELTESEVLLSESVSPLFVLPDFRF